MTELDPDGRLSDDPELPHDVRRAFAAYGAVSPDPEVRAALFARIERAIAAGGPPSRRSSRWSNKYWLLAALLAVSGLSIARLHGWDRGDDRPPPADAFAPSERAPAHDVPQREVDGPKEAARQAAPREAEQAFPERSPSTAVEAPPPAEVPAAPRPSKRVSAPARPAGAADEVTLLVRAKRVLPRDAGAALALTREHTARFPRGVLREEREVIAIDALVRMGESERAQLRAAAFRRQYPHSPHLERIRVILREP